jgi:hypothetical protein
VVEIVATRYGLYEYCNGWSGVAFDCRVQDMEDYITAEMCIEMGCSL